MENNRETETKQYAKPRRKVLGFLRGGQTRIFCIGLVLLFSVSLALPAVAQAASLFISPSSGSYSAGKTLTVSIFVSSTDQAMNAASGIISFDQNKLEIISLSKNGSIFSLWVQEPSFSNITGIINFEGIVLNPGFIGSGGRIISITFKTKTAGTAAMIFSSGSILANDGKGTNILTGLGSANFTISTPITSPTTTKEKEPIVSGAIPAAPVIFSETHPDSEKWYSAATAKFSWKLTDDITDVRLRISQDPKALPTIIYSPAVSSKTVTNLGKGIWYFSAQFKNKYGWGEIAYFRLQIDSTPSEPLEPLESLEPLVIAEKPEGLIKNIASIVFGKTLVSRGIIILISICLIILVMVIWLYYWRTKLLRKKLREEAIKTEETVYEAFDSLRREVTKQVAKLDGNDLLSGREEKINENLKKAIRESEKLIAKKIKNIKKQK